MIRLHSSWKIELVCWFSCARLKVFVWLANIRMYIHTNLYLCLTVFSSTSIFGISIFVYISAPKYSNRYGITHFLRYRSILMPNFVLA
jgi:hypothetical protein